MTGADLVATLKKQPIGTACGIVCILCGVALYIRGDKIAENKQRFDEKSAEAQKIAANVRNGANLPQQVATMQDAAKQLDSRLVRASQLAINQQYFYRLENETGVKLMEVRPGNIARSNAQKATAYSPVPFAVSIQGNFKQVFDFLQRLEKGRHFCRFASISFSKGGSGQDSTELLTVNMSLELLGTP